ncbi:HD domain-containing protein [Myxococcota bacterium]|nr:HD domain-containing protein [Myxococcota bacterium]
MTARLFQDTVRALSLVLDFDEGEKLFHAWRVALLSIRVAQRTGLCAPQTAYFAGLLHDLGGLGLSDHLVHHASRGFTDIQARGHAHRGATILEPFAPFAGCLGPIRDHHERFDGRGFPLGLTKDAINPTASILHLADHLEVVLRASPPSSRWELAIGECRRAADVRVPSEVARGFFDLISKDRGLIDRLYDEKALAADLEALEPAAPENPGADLTETMSQLLWLLARVVDTKHAYTMGHSARVAFWAWRIARELRSAGLNQWDVVWSGLLHDIGKVAIHRSLLNKRTPLSTREWRQLKLHAHHSMNLISQIRDLEHIAYPAAAHHERYAGGGYPLGHAREHIPLIGRILAFADAYDAMTSDRGYNLPLSHDKALASIRGNVGTQFDPRLAPIALRVLEAAPATSTDILQTMGGFADFFRKEEASFLSLIMSGISTSAVIETDQGPELVETGAWHKLLVDADFCILEGHDGLVQSLLNFNSELFLDFIDAHDHTNLRLAAGRLQAAGRLPSPGLEGLLVTCVNGLPLELILLRNGSDDSTLIVLFRSAEGMVHSARQLAMVHTNFSSGLDAVAFLDPAWIVLDVNGRFEELTGQARDRLIGRTLESVLGPESLQRLQAQPEFSGELPFRRADHALVDTDAALVPLSDAARRAVGYMLRAVDITARKRDEARLRTLTEELARKNDELEGLNRLKSDLMSVTSHDLKSPLAAMISQARFLLDFPDRDRERVRTGLTRIVDSGENLLRFIQDLLDLERMDAGAFRYDPAPEHLMPLVREAVETARSQTRAIRISLSCDDGCESVRIATDGRRLLQVLNNLLSNAIRFSPAEGFIRVGCGRSGEDLVRLTVEDDGPGIPQDQLESIFDRYHQVRRTGTDARGFAGAGLGLFIVRKIVELHAGRAWVENREGGGSRFVVELPALQEERGLHVWLYDPNDRIWPHLEAPFHLQHVRLTRLEIPMVPPPSALPDALFACESLCSLEPAPAWLATARRCPAAIISHDEGPPAACTLWPGAVFLTQPVLDTEIVSWLRAVRLGAKGRQEAPE